MLVLVAMKGHVLHLIVLHLYEPGMLGLELVLVLILARTKYSRMFLGRLYEIKGGLGNAWAHLGDDCSIG